MIHITATNDHILIASLNEQVQQLHHLMHPEIFKPFNRVEIENAMLAFILQDNCKAFVAFDGEEPVGYIILVLKETGDNAFHFNVRSVYIDQIGVPEKNRKLGIGNLLMNFAEQFAKEQNINRLQLDHWTANTIAAAYFRKQGYVLQREQLLKEIT